MVFFFYYFYLISCVNQLNQGYYRIFCSVDNKTLAVMDLRNLRLRTPPMSQLI